MSHTFKAAPFELPDGRKAYFTFIHDQGLGGTVRIVRGESQAPEDVLFAGEATASAQQVRWDHVTEMEVEKSSLIEFVAELVRGERVSCLEQADEFEILGL